MNISIALATYNGAAYLQAQLDSFIAQTRPPDELVVTDDASADDTNVILERFAEKAPFKVIIKRNDHNYGYAGNFNQALLKTTGDLVFLSDQDDVWFPDKIERIATIAADDQHSMVFMNDAAITDADLRETGLTKVGQIQSAGYNTTSFVMGCCAAVKRELLDLCLPIPESFPAHDTWIMGIADGMGRKRIVPEVLQYYRRHGDNESQWIVNRTTAVTRWDVFIFVCGMRFPRLFASGSNTGTFSQVSLHSREMMKEWALATASNVAEPYASDLQKYVVSLDRLERAQAQRAKIRQQNFPKRLVSVLRFWRGEGYADFAGVKSAVRDLVGL